MGIVCVVWRYQDIPLAVRFFSYLPVRIFGLARIRDERSFGCGMW